MIKNEEEEIKRGIKRRNDERGAIVRRKRGTIRRKRLFVKREKRIEKKRDDRLEVY